MTIDEKYQGQLSIQDYSPAAMIDGVEVIQLKQFTDDGGNFLEIMRLDDNQVANLNQPFVPAQFSFSVVLPGAVKAYHVHQHQQDLWFVPPQHRLLVNLHDVRTGSPSFDLHQRLVLGGGQARLLRIPAGVAHGVKNCYQRPMFLFYATDSQFNSENPDEHRLPWDIFGKDIWELAKG